MRMPITGIAMARKIVSWSGEGVVWSRKGVVESEEGVMSSEEGLVGSGEGVVWSGEGVVGSMYSRLNRSSNRFFPMEICHSNSGVGVWGGGRQTIIHIEHSH